MLTGAMYCCYGLLLILIAPTISVDILREAAGQAYCRYESDGVICDDLGIRICNHTRCVSICQSLGLEQCQCQNDPNSLGMCSFCCGGYNQACMAVGDYGRAFGSDIPTTLRQSRREFCLDPCPTEAVNGRLCPILNLNKTGICYQGECSDPCRLIDSTTYQCTDGLCTNRTDKWCCYYSGRGCTLMTQLVAVQVDHFVEQLLENGLFSRSSATEVASAFSIIAGISVFAQLQNV